MNRSALTLTITCLAVLFVSDSARAQWTWPVHGDVITTYRNGDDPYAAGQHRGVDIAADTGTPVIAAVGGEVRFAGTAGSSGLVVSIRTSDGLYDTSYLHLSGATVLKGQSVAAGDRIGAVGNTGVRSATQSHLHFGVRDAGSAHGYHDPLRFLPPLPAAPERPRPGPVPAPNPVPPTPVPAPGATPRVVPRAAPHRVPRVEPRRAPRGAPRTAPRHAPRRAPLPGRRHAPRASPAPGRSSAPGHLPAHGGVPARQPGGVPALGDAPARASIPSAASRRPLWRAAGVDPGPARRDAVAGDVPGATGPDAGWALACLGLLAAAALLGLTDDGRKATRSATRGARRRISALLSLQPGGR